MANSVRASGTMSSVRSRFPASRTTTEISALRPGQDGDEQRIPGVDGAPRDADDPLADGDAGPGGGRVLDDAPDHRRLLLVGRDIGPLVEHEPHHQHGQDEVHRRSHDQDQEALPLRLRHELVAGAGVAVLGVLARHPHVAAQRDGADAVLRVPPAHLQQLRPEAEREGQDADAEAAGHDEMAQLVHEDEHAEHEQEGEQAGH